MSGKAMARTGLRMMPTFPWPPLKFRTAGFPGKASRPAGLSDEAFPVDWFAIVLRALPAVTVFPYSESGAMRCVHLRASGPCRSTSGYAVPVHPHLIGTIRPTRGHIPNSPTRGLYEMPSPSLFI